MEHSWQGQRQKQWGRQKGWGNSQGKYLYPVSGVSTLAAPIPSTSIDEGMKAAGEAILNATNCLNAPSQVG